MLEILPLELQTLAKNCPSPLYVVGGSVRDYLAKLPIRIHDWDICSPLSSDGFATLAKEQGFLVQAIYKHTGTVKIKGKEGEYEYACFRSDKYVRGIHTPVETHFTTDVTLDAKRRDFTANAVYFELQTGKYVDPLGGIPAIAERRFTTVDAPDKVFGEDGLRLLRLARQVAQLGFSPDAPCLQGAKNNAHLIADISPERIFEELKQILTADEKCGSLGAGYRGLQLLEQTGVLDYILPELALGRGLAQRADFHKYDVLEHSLKATYYAERLDEGLPLRLAALLHDVGKPLCMHREGNAYAHPEEGEVLTKEILGRLKAPKKLIEEVAWLVKWHMYDFNCQTNENKLRQFLASNYPRIPALLRLKQADYSACMDDTSPAPTCVRWEGLLAKMQAEGVPFSLKELAVNGKDIAALQIPPRHIATVLQELFLHVAVFPKDNKKEQLLRLADSK